MHGVAKQMYCRGHRCSRNRDIPGRSEVSHRAAGEGLIISGHFHTEIRPFKANPQKWDTYFGENNKSQFDWDDVRQIKLTIIKNKLILSSI